ncbi:MAG: translation elongation factor Ts, partial [Pseudomonadota bacterium]
MSISAALVKQLRERTGAGMMECKKALVETGGDIEAAEEHMRKAGMSKADKKAGRVAAEGLVAVKTVDNRAAILEVNCETDFVSGGDDFRGFVDQLAELVINEMPNDLDALNQLSLGEASVEEARRALIAKIGENIGIRRFAYVETPDVMADYIHQGSRIGVVVALEGGDAALAKDVAMHVAALNPPYVSANDVPEAVVSKEREILTEQAAQSGKPEEIIAKMVEGRLRKFLAETTLLGQPFVKDPDVTVEKLLKSSGAKVSGLLRFEVGEGIEKKQEDF